MKHLTYQEALLILPAIIDGEANDGDKAAFFHFIKHHPELRNEYESALLIKEMLKSRLPRHSAPEHLKENILKKLTTINETVGANESQKITSGLEKRLLKETPNRFKKIYSPSVIRYLAAAAVILIITFTTIRLLDQTTADEVLADFFIVENIAAHHFQLTGGQLIEPQWQAGTVTEAEFYLFENFNLNLTVPPIDGAQFAGIVMAEFIENYQIPLLEYVQHEIGETIYVFVFDVDDIRAHKQLKRLDEAVKKSVHSHDFFVAEIEDYHVVSWLWDNNWYTAISNHNGYDLASLIVPLNP